MGLWQQVLKNSQARTHHRPEILSGWTVQLNMESLGGEKENTGHPEGVTLTTQKQPVTFSERSLQALTAKKDTVIPHSPFFQNKALASTPHLPPRTVQVPAWALSIIFLLQSLFHSIHIFFNMFIFSLLCFCILSRFLFLFSPAFLSHASVSQGCYPKEAALLIGMVREGLGDSSLMWHAVYPGGSTP